MKPITPSMFTDFPTDSVLQKHESEIIARNIMVILSRTGNVFRELTWEEYKLERLKDKDFSEGEKYFFDQVIYLASGDKDKIINFCKKWNRVYIEVLETLN